MFVYLGAFSTHPPSPTHTLQSIVIGQNVGKMFYPLLGVMLLRPTNHAAFSLQPLALRRCVVA